MAGLIITEATRRQVALAVATARANPVPLEEVRAAAGPDKPLLGLSDRGKPVLDRVRGDIQMGGYRAAVSFEEQPPGLCCHLSISTDREGTVPNERVLQEVSKLFGFEREPDQVWLEEFEQGHHAVNFIWVVEVAPSHRQ